MSILNIARKANVSIGTVDRVIHNRGQVSPVTRKKVLNVMQEIDYQPNILARHLKKKYIYKLFLVIPRLESESGYWRLIHKGIQRAIIELQTFSLHVEILEFDRYYKKSFRACIKKAIESSASGLIVAPVLQDTAIEVLKHVEYPFVFIDTGVSIALPQLVTTIVQDAFKSGYTAARVMQLMVPHTKSLVVVGPSTNAFNINQRIQGFIQFYQDDTKHTCPNITIYNFPINVLQVDFDTLVEKIFKEIPNIGGFLCVNSAVHYIGKSIQKRDSEEKYIVMGYDLVDENIKGLKESYIDCLISQAPEQQGYESCYALYRKLVMESDDYQEYRIPIDIIFKENLCL